MLKVIFFWNVPIKLSQFIFFLAKNEIFNHSYFIISHTLFSFYFSYSYLHILFYIHLIHLTQFINLSQKKCLKLVGTDRVPSFHFRLSIKVSLILKLERYSQLIIHFFYFSHTLFAFYLSLFNFTHSIHFSFILYEFHIKTCTFTNEIIFYEGTKYKR